MDKKTLQRALDQTILVHHPKSGGTYRLMGYVPMMTDGTERTFMVYYNVLESKLFLRHPDAFGSFKLAEHTTEPVKPFDSFSTIHFKTDEWSSGTLTASMVTSLTKHLRFSI
ncbi:hypothetical protein [Vibrio phage vB_VmeM-Yong XC32]|nr:hypothetical protein [Vibrio phage vB_VmeM-Yong XC31]QAX96352.1 hypothetical protein [Vibrio phage vB_VmeM-Yong XC32]QAX96670.1 hypothetical protein [Vibrio phage vB_VmeM-Yong MS31]QAX96988.1 hypothetical protein [Vibrio phage vB_VmeM-Yong MS32]